MTQPEPELTPEQLEQAEIFRALGLLFGVPETDGAVLAFVQQVRLMVDNRWWADLPLQFQAGEITQVGNVTFRRERAAKIR